MFIFRHCVYGVNYNIIIDVIIIIIRIHIFHTCTLYNKEYYETKKMKRNLASESENSPARKRSRIDLSLNKKKRNF